MTINTIINQLKYSELSNLALKEDNFGMVTLINSALIELYDRFSLQTKEHIISLSNNIVEYALPYDLTTIIGAYDENGDEFTLNDETNLYSLFQISPFKLQIANVGTGTLSIIYYSSPEELIYVDATSLSQVVNLPNQLLEPLLFFVGYRAHSGINANLKEQNNTYYLRYEASCKRIEDRGTVRKDVIPAHINQQESFEPIVITHNYPPIN